MPDKLTDTEIKKALEHCYNNDCDICPYNAHNRVGGLNVMVATDKCKRFFMKDICDLINRQEGENTKNENIIRVADKTIETLNAENESLKAEVERLKNHIQEGIDLAKQIPEMLALTKAEAYKEFAELLFKKAERRNHNSEYHYVLADDIVDILKEFERKENTTYDD